MKSLRLGILLAGLCPILGSAGTLTGAGTGFFDGAEPEKSLGQMIQQAPTVPAAGQAEKTWDAAGFAQGVQQALDKYARLPDAAQQQAIEEALSFLEGTETGFSLCYSLATKCTIQSLAKMNVEIG